MNLLDLNGTLALFGGITGLAFITYMALMVFFARQKDRHVQELQVTLARIEGLLLGRRKR